MKLRRDVLLLGLLLTALWTVPATSRAGAADALSRSAVAPEKVSYKGTKIVQMQLAGSPMQMCAKVYHRKPDKTRTEYVAPPSVAGMITLNIGQNRWQYSPTRRKWAKISRDGGDENLALARRNYRDQVVGEGMIAGRPAVAITLIPKTPGDPSKTVWLDKQYDLVLRSEWRGSTGEVTSWSRFTEIEFNPPDLPDLLFQPPQTPAEPAERPLKRPPFTVIIPGYVPKGYVLADTTVLAVGDSRVVHLKYTNGLNTISLFERVEARTADTPPDPVPNPKALPFPHMVRWQQNGLAFTLIGDVSRSELQKIAESARK